MVLRPSVWLSVLVAFALTASVAGAAARKRVKASRAPAAASSAKGPVVALKTSMGIIRVQLDPAKAPASTENFLKYVDAKFYDGTVFHRVIPGFMVQGGGLTADLKEKTPRAPVKNEAKNGLKNVRGSIAMARTADPNSATSQFFINVVDNVFLDPPGADGYGYAVFGKVVEGMDVVDKIRDVRTTTKGPYANCPAEPVVIESARKE
jgi:peptidyl-prolyl cis-trans isomerase A (cyclophilin A)